MTNHSKKIVLLVNDYSIGGGAEQVFTSHKEIIKDEYTVKTFIGADSKAEPTIAQHFFSFKFFFRLFKILKTLQPDLVHLHNFHNYLSPSIVLSIRMYKILMRKKIKVVYTAHDYHLICPDALLGYYEKEKFQKIESELSFPQIIGHSFSNKSRLVSIYKKSRWLFNYRILKVAKGIDVIVSPSEFLLKKFARAFPNKKTTLVRNPISLPSEVANSNSINRYKENIEMVFLGRISIEKGLLEFVDFLFAEKIEDFTLSIYGEGPVREQLEKRIRQYNFENKVFVFDRIPYEKIPRILKSHDVLVLPSIWYENAPLVLVEAAMNQLRLLTCDYGGMKEIGDVCGDAYYFNYNISGSLNCAIKQMMVDVQNNSSNRNLKNVMNIFSERSYHQSIHELYSVLMQ